MARKTTTTTTGKKPPVRRRSTTKTDTAPKTPAATTTTPVKKTPPKRTVKPAPSKDQEPTVSEGTHAAHELAAVPPEHFFTDYVPRKIHGVPYEDVFDYARKSHTNILMEGPTGSGKTSAVLAYAAQRKMPFYSISSSVGLEPSQLFGRYIPTEDPEQPLRWQDGPVTHLVRHGGVLLINEVNFVPERVSTVLFSLLDKRREIQLVDHEAEVIVAHPDLLIVADMNPNYLGTRPLNPAFRNRFPIQLVWDYDPAIEKKLVHKNSLRDIAKQLRKSFDNGVLETPISTNMLMEFESMALEPSLGLAFATGTFLNHFSTDEKQPVTQIIETHKANLEADYLPAVAGTAAPEEDTPAEEENEWEWVEDVVGTEDNPNPLNDPDWEPSWGIYGKDWEYEESEDGYIYEN